MLTTKQYDYIPVYMYNANGEVLRFLKMYKYFTKSFFSIAIRYPYLTKNLLLLVIMFQEDPLNDGCSFFYVKTLDSQKWDYESADGAEKNRDRVAAWN